MGRDRETIVIERKCGSSRGIHPAVAWQPSTGRCGQWPSSPDVPNRTECGLVCSGRRDCSHRHGSPCFSVLLPVCRALQMSGVPTGIRTPVAAVKGRCPWPLDDGDVTHINYDPVSKHKTWWSQAGSNRRPLACHASALPAELWPRTREAANFTVRRGTRQAPRPPNPVPV